MRSIFTTILFLSSTLSFSQIATTVQTINADSGKNEFKFQAKRDTPDYSNAYRILKKQVQLHPKNAELRYFFGYTIDRMNADDGKGMYKVRKNLTIEASEQIEEVNRLEPTYKEEIYLLDPYGKLTSIWGSLAESYMFKNQIDSAKWAFKEGKKRGGFTQPFLEFNRQVLNSCDKNSILISYGDNIIMPIWYLQTIENYRTDITVIDANLINASWYSKYLKNERNLKIGLSDASIDTTEYLQWKTQTVSVQNPKDTMEKFRWELPPTYMHSYILKGDRILLDVFQQNFYTRTIYFLNGSDSSYNLFLSPYLINEGLVDRVTTKVFDSGKDSVAISQNFYKYNLDKIAKEDILKSKDAILLLNMFRGDYYNNIVLLAVQGKIEKAKELLKIADERFSKDKLPFISNELECSFTNLADYLNSNSH